jgi:hypothetical protein
MAAVTKNRNFFKCGITGWADNGRQVMAKAHLAFGQVS